MKRHALTCSLALLSCCVAAVAQDFTETIRAIEQNNSTLKVLRSEASADQLTARTGLAPADPEVEFAYLWETVADEGGHRIDFGVSQSFDFPTMYYWRKKVSDGECAAAEYRYAIGRKAILLEARKLCINLVYLNALQREFDKCLANADAIISSWQEKYDSGLAGILELNEAKIARLSAFRKAKANRIEVDNALEELKRLNGGEPLQFSMDEFTAPLLPDDFDEWYAGAVKSSSELRAVENEVGIAADSRKVAVSGWLPKFSVGYKSETVAGSSLKGVGAGISIPLWENHGKVRAANARLEAAQAKVKDEYIQYRHSLKSKFEKARALKELCMEYSSTLSSLSPSDLLYEALGGGQITMQEYVFGINLWNESFADLLESERDCHEVIAEIESFAD